MQKKVLVLLVALMLAFTTAACAAGVTLTPVFEGARGLDYVDESEFIIVEDANTRLEGVINTAGEWIIPCEYGAISGKAYGCFEVINENGLSTSALFNSKGEKVTDFQYTTFEPISPKYCAAVTLEAEPTDGELADYNVWGMGKYLVDTYDIYNMETATKLGTFTREEYANAKAHGDYLWVEDRKDNITVYDATLTKVDVAADSLYTAYACQDSALVCLSDGKTILENCNSVSEDNDTETLRVWCDSGVGVCDYNGAVLVPAEYDNVGMVRGNYVPVQKNGLYGLYDIAAGKQVVPCEYDDIPYTFAGGYTRYECNGYVLVKKADKLGFVDLNGNVTCEPKYAESAVTLHGCALSAADIDGSINLIAADGTVTKLDGVTELDKYSGGMGDLLIALKGDKAGVIDMHGAEVLPFEYAKYDLTVTDSGNALIVGDTVYAVAR